MRHLVHSYDGGLLRTSKPTEVRRPEALPEPPQGDNE